MCGVATAVLKGGDAAARGQANKQRWVVGVSVTRQKVETCTCGHCQLILNSIFSTKNKYNHVKREK